MCTLWLAFSNQHIVWDWRAWPRNRRNLAIPGKTQPYFDIISGKPCLEGPFIEGGTGHMGNTRSLSRTIWAATHLRHLPRRVVIIAPSANCWTSLPLCRGEKCRVGPACVYYGAPRVSASSRLFGSGRSAEPSFHWGSRGGPSCLTHGGDSQQQLAETVQLCRPLVRTVCVWKTRLCFSLWNSASSLCWTGPGWQNWRVKELWDCSRTRRTESF